MADNYPTMTHDEAKALLKPGETIVYRTPDGEGHMRAMLSTPPYEMSYSRLATIDKKEGSW
jgi:hypothetical protein